MRAWELAGGFGIERVQATERPAPRPGPGQVRVRVRAASLNYRDLLIVKGLYNPRLQLPRVLLSDGAGEVLETGPGVEGLRPGERVASCFFQRWSAGEVDAAAARSALGGELDGVLAEEVLLREEGLVRVPAHLSFEEAACLPCAALTAWNALVEGGLRPGEVVLILGTGGVSTFALQLAARSGARAIVTSRAAKKLERARALGAWETIDTTATPEWDRRALELTGGRGVDHVVEVGGAGTLPRSLKAVRPGGRVHLIGVLAGGAGELNLFPLIMKGVALRGVFVGSRAMFQAMNRFLEASGLRPVIERVVPAAEVQEALRALERAEHQGKLVLRLG